MGSGYHYTRKIISHHNGFIGHGTNKIAELTTAIKGLLLVPAGSKVELVSDSKYVLKGLTEWTGGWERNDMRNSKKEIDCKSGIVAAALPCSGCPQSRHPLDQGP